MNYIIKDENEKILLFSDNREQIENTLLFKPEWSEYEIEETEDEYVYSPDSSEYILAEDYEEALRQYELARVMKYRMTKFDFFKYVLAPAHITYAQLLETLNQNDLMRAAWDLCNHVYRGDTTLNQFIFAQVPSLTEEILNNLFLMYGEYDESASL